MILYYMYQCRLETQADMLYVSPGPWKLYMMPLDFSQSSHPLTPTLNPLWKWPLQKLHVPEGILKYRCVLTRDFFQLPLLKIWPPTPKSGYTRYSDWEMKASVSLEMHRSSSGEHQLNWYKRAGDFVSKILCSHLLGTFSGRSSRGGDWYKEIIHSG